MKDLKSTDIMLRRMVSFIFAAQQDAVLAFEAWLTEETKAILGAMPYDGMDRKPRPPECLCDGLLVDLSGKKHDVSRAMMQSGALAVKLDCILTQSGLTPMERTVMVRRYMDNIKDSQMISAIDGYTDVDTLFEAALKKISRTMDKEAGKEGTP